VQCCCQPHLTENIETYEVFIFDVSQNYEFS
jgi:hypothetical protein